METIEVKIKGYKIYCENEQHELYDFFIPKQQYRMNMSEAKEYVPEMHNVIAVRRDTEKIHVTYDDLKAIKQK